jgi:tripartite-type tricarboxylate transporter receptor subunit TctC
MVNPARPQSRLSRRSLLRGGAAAGLLALLPRTARADAWPNRPVKLVVPFAPGGTTDMLARLVAARLSQDFGQPFEIDNKTGESGNIAAEFVAKSAPDGYTLIVGTPGIHATNCLIYRSLGYDAAAEIAPVIVIARVPNLLSVTKALPVASVAELIAYAKQRPRELVYGVSALGSTGHLSTELFKAITGVNVTPVPYKGSAPMLADLIEGRIHLTIDNLPASKPHVEAGTIRALAVSTATRSPLLPELPTIAEAGVPGYDTASWFTLGAPAGTPPAIVASLNARVDAFVRNPDGADQLRRIGADPVGGSPEAMRHHVLAEIGKWGRLAKLAGIAPQ